MVSGPKMLNGGLFSVTRQYSGVMRSSRISCFGATSVLVLAASAGSLAWTGLIPTTAAVTNIAARMCAFILDTSVIHAGTPALNGSGVRVHQNTGFSAARL